VRYLIGFGTYTARDDSIGLRIVEHIAEQGLDRDFRALDLSANSLNLLTYLTPETEAILIVDSAKMGLAAGEVRVFAPADVETRKEMAGFSTHEGDVLKVLALARAMNYPVPRILIMGIEPADLASGIGLSAALERRFAEYVTAALDHLRTM
jgi:hydrogenase maturation protease